MERVGHVEAVRPLEHVAPARVAVRPAGGVVPLAVNAEVNRPRAALAASLLVGDERRQRRASRQVANAQASEEGRAQVEAFDGERQRKHLGCPLCVRGASQPGTRAAQPRPRTRERSRNAAAVMYAQTLIYDHEKVPAVWAEERLPPSSATNSPRPGRGRRRLEVGWSEPSGVGELSPHALLRRSHTRRTPSAFCASGPLLR